MKRIATLFIAFILLGKIDAQDCADPANIFQFIYNDKSYEIVKQNMTWTEAAACAVERGGYLAEVNDQAEQDEIYEQLMNNAGINPNNTIAPDGGGASYVWIGGNDIATEGMWIWDGNNDGEGPQFWQGTTSGGPVGGLYNNWGNEPDNWNNQDGLGLAITDWPLGVSGQWNDIDDGNDLYFVIEYDVVLGIIDPKKEEGFIIYPNPVDNHINLIKSSDIDEIKSIIVYNESGLEINIKDDIAAKEIIRIDLNDVASGLYFISVSTENQKFTQKFVKN